MKRRNVQQITFVLMLLISIAHPALAEEKITIQRIKLRINESRYVWSDSSEIPQRSDEARAAAETAPVTVFSYMTIRPGQTLTPADLTRRLARGRFRLEEALTFYAPEIQTVTSRTDPSLRTVIIVLNDGFRERYGGGNAYAFLGRANVAGLRRSWGASAGANILHGFYRDDLLGGGPRFLEASGGYSNTGLVTPGPLTHRLDAALTGGQRLHPDADLHITAEGIIPNLARISDGSLSAYRLALGSDSRWIAYAGTSRSLTLPVRLSVRGAGLFNGNQPLFSHTEAAALKARVGRWQGSLGGAYQSAGNPRPFRHSFFAGSGPLIRSGYTREELTADAFLWAGSETAFRITTLRLPPFFMIEVSPLLFAEAAWIEGARWCEAAGGGLQLYFATPVFVNLKITGGINRTGGARLLISAATEI